MPEISKTADLALQVLVEVSENGPSTPATVAESLGINRTVAHRLLATLHHRGFVARSDGGFVGAALLVHVAESVRPDLRGQGRAAMQRLSKEIGETIVMHVPDGGEAVVLDQVRSRSHMVLVEHKIGSRSDLEIGASGLAILASLSSEEQRQYLASTKNAAALRRRLATIRSRGYEISHNEVQLGVHGVAAPILDREGHALASLAVLVPGARSGRLSAYVDPLVRTATALSTAISDSTPRSSGSDDSDLDEHELSAAVDAAIPADGDDSPSEHRARPPEGSAPRSGAKRPGRGRFPYRTGS